jgi:formate dehydrogenase
MTTAPAPITAGKTAIPSDLKTIHTFCRYCMASCGLEVTVDQNRVTKISADKQNPHSWHDFCAKGRTANQLVEHPRRILSPMRRVGDDYVEATWDEAIRDIAARMNAIIDAGGADAIGAYYGNPSGHSSSNVMFMNAWMDAVGTHSRYAVGSVDQNALHVVAEAMYGSALMVPVSDVDNCDYFLLIGTNPAVARGIGSRRCPGVGVARLTDSTRARRSWSSIRSSPSRRRRQTFTWRCARARTGRCCWRS